MWAKSEESLTETQGLQLRLGLGLGLGLGSGLGLGVRPIRGRVEVADSGDQHVDIHRSGLREQHLAVSFDFLLGVGAAVDDVVGLTGLGLGLWLWLGLG